MISTFIFLQKWKERIPITCFAKGADEEEFKLIERLTGYTMPDRFKELYRCHNGEDHDDEPMLMLGYTWLSLQDIVVEIERQLDLTAEYASDKISYEKEKIQEVTWNRGWIPFAADGSGNYIAMDLAPGGQGVVGQIITCGCDIHEMLVLSSSLEDFYLYVLDAFHQGRASFDFNKGHVVYHGGSIIDHAKELLNSNVHYSDDSFEYWWNSLDAAWKHEITRLLTDIPTSFVQLEKVRFFFVCDESISDLSPLMKFTKLRELSLLKQLTTDLTPLLALKDLKNLSIAQMSVKDISPLAALPDLQELTLYQTNVHDIAVLPAFPKLKKLGLEELRLHTLEPLTFCNQLKELSVTHLKEEDYVHLGSLRKLKSLEIYGAVQHLSFLKSMKQLEKLRLGTVLDQQYEVLTMLHRLKHITCTYEVFHRTHELFEDKKHYTIVGEGTEADHQAYHDYVLGR
ncbi:SMI1/KNR4 family protein [Paenibacillus sp. 1001270B_150601_E10]|uniref:SMI1/KNR4 family protein n=1 Tax=Paenibacillus sp. 1001270B_150601_E10 TaxID=2787079 RepID=UPI00189CB668|nr:SMI1/KNR4 family protein [Paenibacillus sp. 1001270B_150601_E10]